MLMQEYIYIMTGIHQGLNKCWMNTIEWYRQFEENSYGNKLFSLHIDRGEEVSFNFPTITPFIHDINFYL